MQKRLFKPTYLYIKQHSITGKLYLGKFSGSNVEKYKGSGKYWTDHLRIHGEEYVVTLWYCLYLDIESLTNDAKLISQIADVVKSDQWANLVEEDGLMGGWKYANALGLNNSTKSPEVRKKGANATRLKWNTDIEFREKESKSISIRNSKVASDRGIRPILMEAKRIAKETGTKMPNGINFRTDEFLQNFITSCKKPY